MEVDKKISLCPLLMSLNGSKSNGIKAISKGLVLHEVTGEVEVVMETMREMT